LHKSFFTQPSLRGAVLSLSKDCFVAIQFLSILLRLQKAQARRKQFTQQTYFTESEEPPYLSPEPLPLKGLKGGKPDKADPRLEPAETTLALSEAALWDDDARGEGKSNLPDGE